MGRTRRLHLTSQLLSLLLCLFIPLSLFILASCKPPVAGGDAVVVGPRNVSKHAGADRPAPGPKDVLVRAFEAKVAGRTLHFDRFPSSLLEKKDLRAVLEVRFEDGQYVPLENLKLALNGALGFHAGYFDLVRLSHWAQSGNEWVLLVEIGTLQFDQRHRFHEKLRRLHHHWGRPQLWLASGSPRIEEARLLFYRENGAPPATASLPEVVFDQLPPKKSTKRSVTFQFHASHGTPTFECARDNQAMRKCSSPLTYSHLSHGNHRLSVRAVLPDKRRGPTATYDFEVLPYFAPLSIEQVVPSENPTTSESLSIRFVPEGDEDSPRYRRVVCRLDDNAFARCQSPLQFSGLGEGAHTAEIKWIDKKGRDLSEPVTYSWVVDRTAPQLQWQMAPSALTRDRTATFVIASNEAAQFFCSVDGEAATACDSSYSLVDLADGSHSIIVVAQDGAGNRSLPLSRRWIVDGSAPSLSLSGVSPPQSPSNSSSIAISFVANEPSTFDCRLDGQSIGSCESPFQASDLADGHHEFTVEAVDSVGNRSNRVAYLWVIDRTRPYLTIELLFPNRLPTMFDTAKFNFVPSETSTFYCELDHMGVQACESPYDLTNLSEGEHLLLVSAVDLAGNAGEAAAFSWRVDRIPPELSLERAEPPGSITSERSLELHFATSEPVDATCELDGGGQIDCQSPHVVNTLADGPHALVVRARDTAGNVAEPLRYEWEVVSVAVVTLDKITPEESPARVSSIAFEFSSHIASSYECALDRGAFSPCVSPAQYAGLAEGAHIFEVRGINATGVAGPSVSHDWIIDSRGPVVRLDLIEPAGAWINVRQLTIHFSADEPGAFECRVDEGAPAACQSPLTLSNLGDGPHSISIFARDALGNAGNTVTHQWIVDATVPIVTWIGREPREAKTNSRQVSIAFSANEMVEFTCALDGGAPVSCSSPHTISNLTEGQHSVVVSARDFANNESAPVGDTWEVDLTAPVLTLGAHSPETSPSSSTSFSQAFSVAGEGTAYCSLDGATPTQCASPFTASNLSNGDHNFSIFARDAAGNEGARLTHSWTIDGEAPSVAIASWTPGSSPTSSREFSASFSSSEASAAFLCSLDNAASSPCVSPFTVSGLGDGWHQFKVTARDVAGNESAPSQVSWLVDGTVPTIAIDSRTPHISPTGSRSVSFLFHASETVEFFCSLDGSFPSPCASPFEAADLSDGNHEFRLFARDSAGNESNTLSNEWVVDTAASTVVINALSPSVSPSNSRDFSVSFSSTEGDVTFFCSLDGAPATFCASPYTASELAEGSHSFAVHARDLAGNEGDATLITWTVDATSPIVALENRTPASSISNSRNVSLAFSANEAASFFCSLDGGAAVGCSSPFTASNLSDGSHRIDVYAADGAGNQSVVVSSVWSIDASVPVVTLGARAPESSPSSSRQVSLAFSASEAASFFCRLDGGSTNPCSSPFTASNLSDGQHSVAVYATDEAGNHSITVSTSWVVDSIAPSVNITGRTPSGALVVQNSVSISFTSNESPVSFLCSLDGAAAAACSSPYTASNLAEGAHNFTVFSRDSAGNQSASASTAWVIDSVGPIVIIGALSPAHSPSISTSKSIAFGATEGASFTCRFNGESAFSCSSPYQVSGLSDGSHNVVITATDAAGNQSAPVTVSWVVNTAALTTASVAITQIMQTSAVVSWSTSVPANSRVVYGEGSQLNQSTVLDPANVTSHSVPLTGLRRFTFYSIQTIAVDPDGRETRSAIRTFRTAN